jgi:hypothetical protein
MEEIYLWGGGINNTIIIIIIQERHFNPDGRRGNRDNAV